MGLLEEVATYLDAQSTRFTAGTNLFGNFLPDEPNTAVVLLERPGVAPQRVFSTGSPAWENPRLELFCRSTDATKARADADAAWTILEGVVNQSLSGTYYLRIAAVASPYLMGRDEAGRVIFTSSFDIMRSR